MTVKELVKNNRSCRRFDEGKDLSMDTLRDLADLARLSSSGRNIQSLKYFLSCERKTNNLIFPHIGWAGYLEDWDGPEEGERPAGYIIILNDTTISASPGCDQGIAAQSILLGAVEKGLGGCMIGSVHKNSLQAALNLPHHLDIIMVIALGVPVEVVVIDEVRPDGDIKYWRDSRGVHHVPKRPLDSIILHH